MEFRKMVTITLYIKQKKIHRCTEQNVGLCGRRRGEDVLRQQHQNMYIIKGETDHQPRWMHETRARAWCTGMTQRDGMCWGARWEGGSGWGIHINPWLIHVNI